MAKISSEKLFKRNQKDENTFHKIIAPVIALAQCFGIFPIVSIFSANSEAIKFKLISIRTLHAILFIISGITFIILELSRFMMEEALNAKTISGTVFFMSGIFFAYSFFTLATKWNELLKAYKEVEKIFCYHPYSLSGWSLKRRMNTVAFVLLSAALCEHLCAWYSYLYDRITQARVCKWEIHSWFYYIMSLHQSQVYKKFPVTWYTVLWAEYVNVAITFQWSFVDLFIILMSLSISTKFKMINERLEFFKGKITPNYFWDEIRCHYNRLCELTEFVDEILGNLICSACLCDLYYVCLQLLNVATKLPFLANKIYFWYSMVFLIARTFAMFMFASQINDESIKPLAIFRSIPTEGWSPETQRICSQIQKNGTALTGKKFFSMQRAIVISIAGTIITYELVLLQFDGDKILSGMFNPCPYDDRYARNITEEENN